MNTVRQMLELKGREHWSIEASQSIYQAVKMMQDRDVGALAVMDDDARLAGIISERDCARKVLLQNKSSTETRVVDIMTKNVVFVSELTTAEKCMTLMNHKRIRHLPVMDDHAFVGIITVGDLLKFIVKDQLMTIEELENYIMGETGGSG